MKVVHKLREKLKASAAATTTSPVKVKTSPEASISRDALTTYGAINAAIDSCAHTNKVG